MSNSIRNVTKIKKTKHQPVTVIILAAGESRSMPYYGTRSLIDIPNDKNLIDIQLRILNAISPKEIILVGGYEADKVFNKTPNNIIKIENPNYKDNNVTKSISLGLRAAKDSESILLLPGDVISSPILSKFNESFINISKNAKSKNDIGCVINNNYIDNFAYDYNNVTNCLSYFTGKELELLTKFVHNKANHNRIFIEIFEYIINNGGKLRAEFIDTVEIDFLKHIKDLSRLGFNV